MISENTSLNTEVSAIDNVWTSNLNFIYNQEQCLQSNLNPSPFMTCWKIFEVYTSETLPTLMIEETANLEDT